jgi:hypothetical protein
MIEKEFISLICIDPVTDILNFGNGKPELTYGKQYEVDRWFEKHEDGRQFIGIINDSGKKSEYLITRFVTRTTWRNMQIRTILSQ